MADNIIPFPRKPANDNTNPPFPWDDVRQRLPSIPDGAALVAMVYQRLGGMLSISSQGKRGLGRPCWFPDGEIPQLPFATLTQQFHCKAEYEGALKMLEALMSNMDRKDCDFIFDAFAHASVQEAA
jgi:hypothetical protein